MKHVIVGTAGHIDHGKTELVRALTGVDCDRLDEEKKRGITIDIGFAPLTLDGDVHLGFIDVPGHERFVKNMLAGASGIDVVILVVAADESIKPQTREHFDICRLLGVSGGLVALTKADLADADMREIVALEVRELVKGSFLEGAPVVPVSARTGEGLPRLKAALHDLAIRARDRSSTAFFRLPVDRSFSIKGFGAVATGTLVAGEVADGDEVAVYPHGDRARVRGVQVHGRSVSRATAGLRTALNLQGMDASRIVRGHVLAPPGFMEPSSLLDVDLSLLAGVRTPLEDLGRVRFHQGTSEVLARVKLLGITEIPPGGRACAQLRLETPGLSLPGDRFVIRQYSPMITIGGGIVLDAHPAKHRGAAVEAAERLAALARDGPAALPLYSLEASPTGLTPAELVIRTGWKPSEIARITADLVKAGKAVALGESSPIVLHASWLARHRERALEILGEFHRRNPLMMGLPRQELCEKTIPSGPADMARAVLEKLAGEGLVRLEKELAALASHRLSLSADEQRLMDLLDETYRTAGLNPSTLEEVVDAAKLDASTARRIYHLLLSRGRLVRIKDGRVFHTEPLEVLKAKLWDLRRSRPVIDVAVFKELTGTSRKNAIPLLEHLDAERVTRRKGNDREILPPPGTPAPTG
jgi:selenocysteine-specific elongation factor